MKTKLFAFALATVLFGFGARSVSAQMMGNGYGPGYGMMGDYEAPAATAATRTTPTTTSATSSATTDSGDAAGAALWTKFTNHELTCADLTDSDFAALGDYFMGNMMGASHDSMDQYMTSTLGQSGDEQMHIAMGQRFTGCNVTASYPAGVSGFGPMMMNGYGPGYGMMNGGYGYGPGYRGGWGTMANNWYGLGGLAALYGLAIFGLVSLIRLAMSKR